MCEICAWQRHNLFWNLLPQNVCLLALVYCAIVLNRSVSLHICRHNKERLHLRHFSFVQSSSKPAPTAARLLLLLLLLPMPQTHSHSHLNNWRRLVARLAVKHAPRNLPSDFRNVYQCTKCSKKKTKKIKNKTKKVHRAREKRCPVEYAALSVSQCRCNTWQSMPQSSCLPAALGTLTHCCQEFRCRRQTDATAEATAVGVI